MSSEDRKRQIVEVALDIISEYGLKGLTMARLATGVGIKQASIYTHFESRDEIVLAALEAIDEKVHVLRPKDGDNTLQHLRQICDEHVRLWAGKDDSRSNRILLEFMSSASGEGLRERFASMHRKTMDDFIAVVEAGKKEGKIPGQVNPRQVAWFVTSWVFAGDLSQAIGFESFLDQDVSTLWLDIMFDSFVTRPLPSGGAAK
jgi:AcrR family transcriptional regulator